MMKIKHIGLLFTVVFWMFPRHGMTLDLSLDWNAFISNDLRLSVDPSEKPSIYRNRSTAGFAMRAGLLPDRLRFVADIQFVWTGFPGDMEFHELTTRSGVSPFHLESDAAYLEVLEILPYLDLRIGRQIVTFGTADMFNPTSHLNALNLEDPLAFGKRIANQMIRLDFNPGYSDFILSAIWVPVFQPSQLPPSALLEVGDVTAKFPFVNPETRLEAEKLRNIYLRNPDSFDVIVPDVRARMPSASLTNSQFGARAQWLTGNIDTSVSYYIGRSTLPVSVDSVSTQETGRNEAGAPVMKVYTDVELYYPKQQVLGFDFAGELPFLAGMGFWFEGAVVFPEEVRMNFDITKVVPSAQVINGYVVRGTPFFKCTAGVDHTIARRVLVVGQFIHGFPDEFGIDAIRNYWMAMAEIKFFQERLSFRNVFMGEIPHMDDDLNLDEDGDGRVESLARGATNDGKIGSLVYFPEVIIRPLDGLELSLGAYLRWGHSESKFAMAAAGPPMAFFRARASF